MSTVVFYILAVFSLSLTGAWKSSNSNAHLPDHCGMNRYGNKRPYSDAGRIIGGSETMIGEYPWIVRIGKFQTNGDIYFYCGGSLVNRYYVISAAHCKDGEILRLGEHYLDSNPDCQKNICAPKHQDIRIETYRFRKYDVKTDKNDISLIELRDPATLNEFVQPICLPKKRYLRAAILGKSVRLPGWGSIHKTMGKAPNQLMHITAPVVESSKCNILYKRMLLPSQLCIGYDKGKDSCGGDSGGPVSLNEMINGKRREVLLGVVSFGLKVCGDGPAVYTDVSFYMDWILKNINRS